MKPTKTRHAVVLLLLLLASTAIAVEEPAAAAAQAEPAAHEQLADAMQSLQARVRRVGKALEKKDLAAVAELSLEMQKAAFEAKTKVPEKAATIGDAQERAQFLLGFRKQLIALERSLLDLETAALDGKLDEARKIVDEAIGPMKKTGHAHYKD